MTTAKTSLFWLEECLLAAKRRPPASIFSTMQPDVLIDASVLEGPVTGVAKAMLTSYAGVARVDPALRIEIVHQKPILQEQSTWMSDTQLAEWCPKPLWRRYALPLYIRKKRARVIHFPWNSGVVDAPRGSRSLLTLHDLIHLALPDKYFKTENQLLQFARRTQINMDASDCILTDSECSKRDILRHLRPKIEPVVVYPSLGPAHQSSSQITKSFDDQAPFVYLGGFEQRKGVELLVSVHRELFTSGLISRKLVLLGQCPTADSELRRSIDSAKTIGAVSEPGYVSDSEVARWLSLACALAYPSLYEGFGYPPLEAMASGCPVITTRGSSMPEVCGDAALYIWPGSRSDLASAMVQVSRDKTMQARLAQEGLKQAARFSWERSSHRLLTILHELRGAATADQRAFDKGNSR